MERASTKRRRNVDSIKIGHKDAHNKIKDRHTMHSMQEHIRKDLETLSTM